MGPLLDRPRPRLAVGVGISLTIVVALAVAPLRGEVARTVPALLLVVPVIVAAVLGGRAPAFITAAAATLAFSLALPPFGSLRIRLGEDVVALVVFSGRARRERARDHEDGRIARRRRGDAALLRSVSHDLRTPLSAIHAVATDLRSGTTCTTTRTRNELLDIMIDETDRLDRFVANL
jgi:two-component system sensor histidine kinase KdpD